jgi:cation-transporting ATPase 13A3/4/5
VLHGSLYPNVQIPLKPQIDRSIAASDVTIKALDLITIVIPPALPAALTVGKLYAQNRLQACKIYCINSRVINVAGSINCVCFDKVRR